MQLEYNLCSGFDFLSIRLYFSVHNEKQYCFFVFFYSHHIFHRLLFRLFYDKSQISIHVSFNTYWHQIHDCHFPPRHSGGFSELNSIAYSAGLPAIIYLLIIFFKAHWNSYRSKPITMAIAIFIRNDRGFGAIWMTSNFILQLFIIWHFEMKRKMSGKFESTIVSRGGFGRCVYTWASNT